MSELRPGDQVRFSEAGVARVRQMPEAWGLHTALYREQVGEVTAIYPAEGDQPQMVDVEFEGGAAWNWEASCFVSLTAPAEEPDP